MLSFNILLLYRNRLLNLIIIKKLTFVIEIKENYNITYFNHFYLLTELQLQNDQKGDHQKVNIFLKHLFHQFVQ